MFTNSLLISDPADQSIITKKLMDKNRNVNCIDFEALTRNKNYLFYLLKSETRNDAIGAVCIYDIDNVNKNAYIDGFVIDTDYTKELVRGLVSLIETGFDNYGLNKICTKLISDNKYYFHLYDYLRFVHEGYLREHVKVNDKFYNVEVRSLLHNEFILYYLSGNHKNQLCSLEGW